MIMQNCDSKTATKKVDNFNLILFEVFEKQQAIKRCN